MEGCVLRPPNSQLFSDNVIGGVVQRCPPASRYCSPQVDTQYHPHQGRGASPAREQGETGAASTNFSKRQWGTPQGDAILSTGRSMSPLSTGGKLQPPKGPPSSHTAARDDEGAQRNARAVEPTTRNERHVAMAELAAAEQMRLRDLRRMRQIRYRKKKENYMHSLEDETRQLRGEIEQLEQRRRSVSAAVPAGESAWSVAAEYFRLFQYGVRGPASASTSALSSPVEPQPSVQLDFLRSSMTPDVVFNTERGVEAMLRTWSCISRWFAGVEMDLERLDKDASGSLVATMITTVTITEHTLRVVFPHLSPSDGGSRRVGSAMSFLAGRLVGQTIAMRGFTRFEWDGAYCRMTSMLSQSDMLTPILRLVESLEGVSCLFEGALITPDFRLKSV